MGIEKKIVSSNVIECNGMHGNKQTTTAFIQCLENRDTRIIYDYFGDGYCGGSGLFNFHPSNWCKYKKGSVYYD